jgi:hypothetical protein
LSSYFIFVYLSLAKLGHVHLEGLVFDLNDALELEDALKQKVNQIDRGLVLNFFVLIYFASDAIIL